MSSVLASDTVVRSQPTKTALYPKPLTVKLSASPLPSKQASSTSQTPNTQLRRSSSSSNSQKPLVMTTNSNISVKSNNATTAKTKPIALAVLPSSSTNSSKPTAVTTKSTTNPSLAIKDSGTGPQLSTSKVWVLPPRPKPGRKPSTDTPATKRKAQNRAAQRAFRERRAARVAELEELLNEVQAERDLREQQLSDTLKTVSAENNGLRQSLDELRKEMELMRQQQQFQLQLQQQINQQHCDRPSPSSSSAASTPASSAFSSYSSAISPATSVGTPLSSLNSYSMQKSYALNQQNKQFQLRSIHKNSISSNHSGVSPASGFSGYSPSMDNMESPAPSGESHLDVLDHILEMRLPVPNKPASLSSPSISNKNTEKTINDSQLSTNSIENLTKNIPDNTRPIRPVEESSSDEDDCGVCVKDDCICESLGIRKPRNRSARQTSAVSKPFLSNIVQTVTDAQVSVGESVPIKRKRKSGAINELPFFKKLKRDSENLEQPVNVAATATDQDEDMEIDFTNMFSKQKTIAKSVTNKPQPSSNSISARTLSFSAFNDSSHNAGTPIDRCGFCSDGTPCLCAESSAQEAKDLAEFNQHNNLPSLSFSPITTDSLNFMPGSSRRTSRLSFSRSRQNSTIVSPTDEKIRLPSITGSLTSDISTSSYAPSKGGCTGNPGTCSQCRSDPMSTLFCTTLAARVSAGAARVSSSRSSLSKESTGPAVSIPKREGCCGGRDKNGRGCCGGADGKKSLGNLFSSVSKASSSATTSDIPLSSRHLDQFSLGTNTNSSKQQKRHSISLNELAASVSITSQPQSQTSTSKTNNNEDSVSSSGEDVYIPCSAAYQTLSRHKDFKQVDLGKLVGKLTTRGMQVEVASVANVLRELDRRLYD